MKYAIPTDLFILMLPYSLFFLFLISVCGVRLNAFLGEGQYFDAVALLVKGLLFAIFIKIRIFVSTMHRLWQKE